MSQNHLVLLMGTNPLPNYVVAKYFLFNATNLPNIWVLCSEKTRLPAERLEKVLKKDLPQLVYGYCDLDDPGDAVKIQHNLRQKLLPNFKPDDSVHLNYTGGTKSMVVHSYITLAEALPRGNVTYSYLDAHNFMLRFDHEIPEPNLRETITIDFDQLLSLHDCSKKSVASESDWSQANEIIEAIIAEQKLAELVKWINTVIQANFFRNDKRQKPSKFHKDYMRYDQYGNEIPGYHEATRLISQFPPEQQWKFDERQLLMINDTDKQFKSGDGKFVQGIRYLHGLWLEYYIIQLLKEAIKSDSREWRLHHNWHIVKGAAEKDFEIDLTLLYGYQLCGISVTSSFDEGLCKSKAFEILHRSQQMGGEEARSVLITTLSPEKVEKMARDLETDVGGENPLLILGVDDLQSHRIWEAIRKHIIGD